MAINTLTAYDLNPNLHCINGEGLKPANAVWNTQLAATTEKTIVLPNYTAVGQAQTNQKPQILVKFGYQSGSTVFVAVNQTAAPDTSGTLTAGFGVINPVALLCKGGDTIHVYPAAQAFMSIALYYVG